MDSKAPTIIGCPVCNAQGATLHHDIRASLVYSCQRCLHEWQIDPAEEPPPQGGDTVAPKAVGAGKPHRPR